MLKQTHDPRVLPLPEPSGGGRSAKKPRSQPVGVSICQIGEKCGLELTAGQTSVLWESALGFRHGPGTFVTDSTSVYVFKSSNLHSSLYDSDLVSEVRKQFPDVGATFLGTNGGIEISADAALGGAWLTPLHIALSQVLAAVWSDRLGMDVDDPFGETPGFPRVVSDIPLYRPSPRP